MASRRGADLAKQMLAYAGKATVASESVEISQLVRSTTELLRASVSKHIRLSFDLWTDGLWTDAGVTQIRQVVMNLVINAAEAIGDVAGEVILRTAAVSAAEAAADKGLVGGLGPATEFLMIEVLDSGPGLSAEVVERLFEPFYTTKEKGRGLGLAAVQGIVGRHEGGLSLTSWPGRGTRFRVYLPRIDGDTSDTLAPVDIAPAVGSASGTVLVIDDEDPVRRFTQLAVERMGFRVLAAATGSEGVALFEANKGDIVAVVVDFVMPGANGIEVLTTLRDMKPGLPALFVSGYSELGNTDIFDTGPTDLLPKPFDLATLHQKLQGVLVEQPCGEVTVATA